MRLSEPSTIIEAAGRSRKHLGRGLKGLGDAALSAFGVYPT